MKGVDISHYQGGLTIRQLKDAGMEFAIIKLTEGTGYVDPSSFEFYKEAYELGFPVGCYCYSHAVNAQQAMAEAAFLADAINGFPMPCGIFLDVEEPKQLGLDHDALLDMLYAWCTGIAQHGYVPGIYGSEGNLWAKISPDELPEGTLVWVARWGDTQPDTPCDLWQNSDSGRVEGYDGPVDTDIARSESFRALVLRGPGGSGAVPAAASDSPHASSDITGALALLAGYLRTDAFAEGFRKYWEGEGGK